MGGVAGEGRLGQGRQDGPDAGQIPCGGRGNQLRLAAGLLKCGTQAHGRPAAQHPAIGADQATIKGIEAIKPRQALQVEITREDGTKVTANTMVRIDTENELDYYRNGGILHYVLRNLARDAA